MNYSTLPAEELSILAYAHPPIQPQGLALAVVIVSALLLAVNFVAVGLRVWVRSWYFRSSSAWGIDDTLAAVGFLPFIPCCVFAVLASCYGLGTRDADLDPLLKIRAREYMTYGQIHYAVGISIAKASIATALLRLTTERRYRIPIWVALVSSALVAAGGLVSLIIVCRPLQASWNPGLGTCLPYHFITLLAYIMTVVAVITDLLCASIPFLLLRGLQIPIRRKCSVMGVLTLGVTASMGSMIRAPFLKHLDIEEDKLYYMGQIILWSVFEYGIGILAGSLPAIGKLVRSFRGSDNDSQPHLRAGAKETIGGTPFSIATRLDTLTPKRVGGSRAFVSSSGNWGRLGDDENSRRGIIQETLVESISDEPDDALPL